MSIHALKNVSDATVTIVGISVPVGESLKFYNDSTNKGSYVSNISSDIVNNGAINGINYMLANSMIAYTIDGVQSSNQLFYDALPSIAQNVQIGSSMPFVQGELYYSSTSPITVANTIAKTSLMPSATALTAAAQNHGNVYNISVDGFVKFASLLHAVTISPSFGGISFGNVTIVGSSIPGAVVDMDYHWRLSMKMGAHNAPGSNVTVGLYGVFEIIGSSMLPIDVSSTIILDTTKSNVFDLSVTWSNANVGSSISSGVVLMQQINNVGGNGGSVISVGMTVPSIFSLNGSPVISSGTFAISLVSQRQNQFFAAPYSSIGIPEFRHIVPLDLGSGTPSSNTWLCGDGTWQTIDTLLDKLSSARGIGYIVGDSGTVTQTTDKSTEVALNKPCGTITMASSQLSDATTVSFTLTNSFIAATDLVLVQHTSGGTLGAYNFAVAPNAGSAVISVRNVHTAPLSEAIVLRFAVVKAATA